MKLNSTQLNIYFLWAFTKNISKLQKILKLLKFLQPSLHISKFFENVIPEMHLADYFNGDGTVKQINMFDFHKTIL